MQSIFDDVSVKRKACSCNDLYIETPNHRYRHDQNVETSTICSNVNCRVNTVECHYKDQISNLTFRVDILQNVRNISGSFVCNRTSIIFPDSVWCSENITEIMLE